MSADGVNVRSVLKSYPLHLQQDRAKKELDRISGIEKEVGAEFVLAGTAEDWSYFGDLVIVAFWYPDRSYVPALVEALDLGPTELSPEDVAELLGEIRDARAIPALVRAMYLRLDHDEFGQLARKCVWALSRIRTEEAIRELRRAAHSGDPVLRRYAGHELEVMGKREA